MNQLAAALFIGLLQVLFARNAAGSPRLQSSLRVEFECPAPDGNFPIPGQCSSNYYLCIGGQVIEVSCQNGLIFDPETLKCVSADEASCSGEATTESFTTQTTTQPQTTASTDTPPFTCSDNGNFPVPDTCGSDYIICIGGVAYPTKCPGGATFDPQSLLCVPAGTASCERTSTQSTTTTTEVTTSPTTSPTTTASTSTTVGGPCPEPNGNFPNPEDCGSYYVCTNDSFILIPCPPGLVFNPALGICDIRENVPGCSFNQNLGD